MQNERESDISGRGADAATAESTVDRRREIMKKLAIGAFVVPTTIALLTQPAAASTTAPPP